MEFEADLREWVSAEEHLTEAARKTERSADRIREVATRIASGAGYSRERQDQALGILAEIQQLAMDLVHLDLGCEPAPWAYPITRDHVGFDVFVDTYGRPVRVVLKIKVHRNLKPNNVDLSPLYDRARGVLVSMGAFGEMTLATDADGDTIMHANLNLTTNQVYPMGDGKWRLNGPRP